MLDGDLEPGRATHSARLLRIRRPDVGDHCSQWVAGVHPVDEDAPTLGVQRDAGRMASALRPKLDDAPACEGPAPDADPHQVSVAELGEVDDVAEDGGYGPVPWHLAADRRVGRGDRAAL